MKQAHTTEEAPYMRRVGTECSTTIPLSHISSTNDRAMYAREPKYVCRLSIVSYA